MITLLKRYHTKKSKQSENTKASPDTQTWLPLSQKLFDRLVEVTRHYDLYSDFIATNIWAYMGSGAMLHFHGDGVAIRMIDDYTKEYYYTLISKKSTAILLKAITDHATLAHDSIVIRHVPKETIKYLKKHDCLASIEPDRDNHDYVYSVDKFIHFNTRKLKPRKKQLEKCQRQFPDLILKKGFQDDTTIVRDIFTLYDTWIQQTHQKNWEKDYDALKNILKQKTVPQLIIALYDAEKMVGFTVNEVVHSDYYIGFSGKSNREYPNLSILLEHETAKIMKHTYGCKYLNLQQDMGIEGLRNYKLSLSPDRLVEKYTVTIVNKAK